MPNIEAGRLASPPRPPGRATTRRLRRFGRPSISPSRGRLAVLDASASPATGRLSSRRGGSATRMASGGQTLSRSSAVARPVGLPDDHVQVAVTRRGAGQRGAVTEHRAGDVLQAIGNRARGAAVTVTAGSRRPVLAVADRSELDGDSSPVEVGVGKSAVRCQTALDHQALARTLRDRNTPHRQRRA